MKNIDIDKIVVSNKVCFGKKGKNQTFTHISYKTEKKIKNIIDKESDNDPVYNEKYLKANIKSYNGKINTDFHNNKMLREGSQCICLTVI